MDDAEEKAKEVKVYLVDEGENLLQLMEAEKAKQRVKETALGFQIWGVG